MPVFSIFATMQSSQPTIHIALPAMNEYDYIHHTLQCIQKQTLSGFHTWICVNQPEFYRHNNDKKEIFENNQRTLTYLQELNWKNLHIIDRSSPGKGWDQQKLGVGMARKTIMDAIAEAALPHDIIVSMDADTVFGEEFLASVLEVFEKNPDALALANPYYHPLAKEEEQLNRAMLRYELYMRYYALNMRLTGTPYCFSPLGSAMAARVSAYKKINGLTPKKSGEDFYFLQKMVKAGRLLMYNKEIVYPGNRLSDRVFFGTGPAMIKGLSGQWSSYPLFHPDCFDKAKQTIDLFPRLFEEDVNTPLDDFILAQWGGENIFSPLRKNHKNSERFVKACHEKLDGLRILQFLKICHTNQTGSDEEHLRQFVTANFSCQSIKKELEQLDFLKSSVENINKIRNFLFEIELKIQKEHDEKNRKQL